MLQLEVPRDTVLTFLATDSRWGLYASSTYLAFLLSSLESFGHDKSHWDHRLTFLFLKTSPQAGLKKKITRSSLPNKEIGLKMCTILL